MATTYLHYLPSGLPSPAVGTKSRVGAEDNRLWRRKQEPPQTTGMYSIRPSDREWAQLQVAKRGGTIDAALAALRTFRQTFDIKLERILEANRPAHLPSRQRCMYLWDDRDDWEADARSMNFDPNVHELIRILPVPGESTVHRASLDALEISSDASDQEIAHYAKKYWAEVPDPGPRTEVLLIGAYEVVALGVVCRR